MTRLHITTQFPTEIIERIATKLLTPGKKEVAMCLLGIIATVGIVSVFAIAPGLVLAIKPFLPYGRRSWYPSILKQTLARLERRDCVRIRRRNSPTPSVEITPYGMQVLSQYELHKATLPKPRHWDQHWRLIIFDIRENKKYARDRMRDTLKKLGLVRLQDSVWAYPYDCEVIVDLLKAALELRSHVLYLVVKTFPEDWLLRKTFGLQS